MIFISHRSTDKAIVSIFVDFLKILGVPSDSIFCSSLPGNDVKSKIDDEIRENLEKSKINIIFLSNDYYKSAFCQNEAGIIWFLKRKTIIVALPEINESNLLGFIDHNNKLRRLDISSDIAGMYDIIESTYNLRNNVSFISSEINKLVERCSDLLKRRREYQNNGSLSDNVLTDDEAAILYYIWEYKKFKIKISDVNLWLQENEIYNIDTANGVNLLVAGNNGIIDEKEWFALYIDQFRILLSKSTQYVQSLKLKILKNFKPSKKVFQHLWDVGKCTDTIKLFISYIIDEKVSKFGYRWKANDQKKEIEEWESKNLLSGYLSIQYENCLQFFIKNKLVYASEFTSCGNAREYTLHKTLKEFLLGNAFPYLEILKLTKDKYRSDDYPF